MTKRSALSDFEDPTYWCDRTAVRMPMYYAMCTSREEFHAHLTRCEVPRDDWPKFHPADSTAAATCFYLKHGETGRTVVLVTLNPGYAEGHTAAQLAAVLVHEATHIKQWFMGDIGEDEPSAEFEAYTMQSICEELFNAYQATLVKPPEPKKGKAKP